MRRNHHLIELIDDIKKTDEMISLHKNGGDDLSFMSGQYEALKAKQISELIDNLSLPPYQSVESIGLIKNILNRFYPNMLPDVTSKELQELAAAI